MTTPLGAADFFALEAGEYLERLGAQVARTDGPAPDEFMRFSRALRGSALMAKQSDIAHAAGGLEGLARKHREGAVSWTPAVREVAGQAVEELKLLVRAAGQWTDAHRERARRVARDLAEIGGKPAAPPPRTGAAPRAAAETPSPQVSAGVRAFVAREAALIASALDRAATTLRSNPAAKDPLETVIRRMQSLRGLAELNELPPLPEILEGIELAAGELTRTRTPPPFAGDLFDAAAKAITRIARDVANQGQPDPDAEEGRRFADLLFRGFAAEDDVVAIASLAPNDGEPQIIERGTVPAPDQTTAASAVQLVSHGEYLRQAAADVRRCTSETERELRLFAIAGSLRASSGAGGGAGVGAAWFTLGKALRAHITGRHASRQADRFATMLEEAGEALRSSTGPASDEVVIGKLNAMETRLRELPTAAPAPTAPAPAPAPAPATATAASAPLPPGEVVPIEELAPDPAPREPGFRSDLATSFVTFARLLQERPVAPASLDAFLRSPGSPAAAPTAVPSAGAGAQQDVVGIGSLLYAGPAALDRALAVQEEIRRLLARERPWESVRPLVEELLDLVPLARHGLE